jgi:hypothetical protein
MCSTLPPKHGSWLNQVELWLSVLARRFLKRGDFCSAQDFEARLCDYLEVYNTHQAHPYRWTYTGNPWYGLRRSAKRVVNSVKGEPGLALSPSDLSGPFIRLDLTRGPQHDWQRTYETDI